MVTRKRLFVDSTGIKTISNVLLTKSSTRFRVTDINLQLSGAGIVTIYGSDNTNDVIYRGQVAAAGAITVTSTDLFAGIGKLILAVSTNVTVIGNIFYYEEGNVRQ